jgi:hypothetical protein
MDRVREHEKAGAETLHQPTRGIELQDGRKARTRARVVAAALNTHTLPLPSTSIALVEPQGLLSFAHPCSAEYDVRSSGALAERVGPAHADTSATRVAHAIAASNAGDSKGTFMKFPKTVDLV